MSAPGSQVVIRTKARLPIAWARDREVCSSIGCCFARDGEVIKLGFDTDCLGWGGLQMAAWRWEALSPPEHELSRKKHVTSEKDSGSSLALKLGHICIRVDVSHIPTCVRVTLRPG